jgi:hypothetical protein
MLGSLIYMPVPSSFEVEIAVEELMRYKSPERPIDQVRQNWSKRDVNITFRGPHTYFCLQ